MGQISCGPQSWTRPCRGEASPQAFVWCRIERRVSALSLVPMKRSVSLPALSVRAGAKRWRLRAKGGVSAFAPTISIIHHIAFGKRRGHSINLRKDALRKWKLCKVTREYNDNLRNTASENIFTKHGRASSEQYRNCIVSENVFTKHGCDSSE
jgi:hypothetical protein